MAETERELVLVSEAAEALGITPAAVHWHIKNNGVYVEEHGEAKGRRAWFFLVDLNELRGLVRSPEVAGE